jgi:hypothetical protein
MQLKYLYYYNDNPQSDLLKKVSICSWFLLKEYLDLFT